MIRKILSILRGVDTTCHTRVIDDIKKLNNFNRIWNIAISNYSFYSNYCYKNNLPKEIKSLIELEDFPIITREDIIKNQKSIIEESKNSILRTTGGSSGTPILIPFSKFDRINDYKNIYSSRSFFLKDDPKSILMLWGHSHLFGSNIYGYLNNLTRKVKDFLTGITRISVYGDSISVSNKALKKLTDKKYDILIGYSSHIINLTKLIDLNKNDINFPSLLVLTAESFTKEDYLFIKSVFKKSIVISEYGSSETGVIASGEPGVLSVFNDFILQNDINHGLIVTSLKKKSFPLIRYAIGDTVKDAIKDSNNIINNFSYIEGRIGDKITLNGTDNSKKIFSSLELQHIFKTAVSIWGIQFYTINENIFIVSSLINKLDLNEYEKQILNNFKKCYDKIDLNKIHFKYSTNLKKSISGKVFFRVPNEYI
jgi:phenylacetate-CoA ligase